MEPTPVKATASDEWLAGLWYGANYSLTELGEAHGHISRQRVWQLIERSGMPPRQPEQGRNTNPTLTLRTLRQSHIMNWKMLGRESGQSVKSCKAALEALGLSKVATRLFRARKAKKRTRRIQLELRLYADNLGRIPTADDVLRDRPALYSAARSIRMGIVRARALAGMPRVDLRRSPFRYKTAPDT